MPSTDRKVELKAKISVAQTGSQPFVYAKGLIHNKLNTKSAYRRFLLYSCTTIHGQQSILKTNQLMLHEEIFAVCSHIRIKHRNTLCGKNGELLKLNWWYI
jgi:hypothetical protein